MAINLDAAKEIWEASEQSRNTLETLIFNDAASLRLNSGTKNRL